MVVLIHVDPFLSGGNMFPRDVQYYDYCNTASLMYVVRGSLRRNTVSGLRTLHYPADLAGYLSGAYKGWWCAGIVEVRRPENKEGMCDCTASDVLCIILCLYHAFIRSPYLQLILRYPHQLLIYIHIQYSTAPPALFATNT